MSVNTETTMMELAHILSELQAKTLGQGHGIATINDTDERLLEEAHTALLAWKNRALREFAATAGARIMAADPGSDNGAESYGLNKSLDVIDAALAEAVEES